MTMVSSGPISLGGDATSGGLNQSINIELVQSATATISLNDSNVRTLLLVPSGTISLNDAYGKANLFPITISTNQTNVDLRTFAINAGWNQSSRVIATINPGVYISSNNTGTPALTVSGSFPSGVEIINNGFIVGMGGAGGAGGGNNNGGNGQSGGGGGLALSVLTATTINNASGTVAGGGGGGGGGAQVVDFSAPCDQVPYGGGGGGGGRSGAAANSAGGAGGQNFEVYVGSPGAPGTVSAAGGGGNGSDANGQAFRTAAGGSGGGWGSAGSAGFYRATNWPILGGNGAAGAGGAAISGNSNINWTAFGTRIGSIS